jgi:hypothetical protein
MAERLANTATLESIMDKQKELVSGTRGSCGCGCHPQSAKEEAHASGAAMLASLRQTDALAVSATPELQHLFSDWLTDIESRAAAEIAQGERDVGALASTLKISEDSARYILGRLASSGKVTLVARARA